MTPTMDADIKFAMVPQSMARMPSWARSERLLGASAPMPPIWMPMELKFAKTEEVADSVAVLPGNANDPGDGGKDPAENLFQAGGKPGDAMARQQIVGGAEQAVDQINHGDEGDQHGGNVE